MHGLEVLNRRASFAFDGTRGDPWHRLGTPMAGLQTKQKMLQVVGADFEAYKAPLVAKTRGGDTEVEDLIAVSANRPIGPEGQVVPQVFGVLGSGYTVVQYENVVDKALTVVGASEGQAVLDTMGLLFDGKRFFAYIALDDLVIDPKGIGDKIERGLALYSSHDGTIAVTYAFTDIRVVCYNTVSFAVANAERLFKARHTAKVEDRMAEAQQVLGVSTAWADAFNAEAERLLSVKYTQDRFARVLKKVFPSPSGATERQERNAMEVRDSVRVIFANERNAGTYGESGWTMVQAIGEYLDHHRKGKEIDRAVASMTPGSWVEQKKLKAQAAVLQYA